MPGSCPRFVFACFRRVERWGDKVTGAAGPFFVAVAALLFVVGTLCFRLSLFFIMFFLNQLITTPSGTVISRYHSSDHPLAMADRPTVLSGHYQLVRPLLLCLHHIPRFCK